MVTTICHTLSSPRRKQCSAVIYIPCLNFSGSTGMCLHWKMFVSEKVGMEKVCYLQGKAWNCPWLCRKCISTSSCAGKTLSLTDMNLQKALLFLSYYWTEIFFFFLIYWQPFRFPLSSFKAFSRPRNWLTVGSKFLSSHAEHPPTPHAHFSAQFYLISYWLTDHHCCSFHPPHSRVPRMLRECSGATDRKTSIVWSWEN